MPLQVLSSGSLLITKVNLAFDNNQILCKTRVKPTRNDNKLKLITDESNLEISQRIIQRICYFMALKMKQQ